MVISRPRFFRSAACIAFLWTLMTPHAFAATHDDHPALIPFTIVDGNIVVTVRIEASGPLPFVFDSGLSNFNIISIETARTLALKSKASISYGDASGSGNGAALTRVPSFRVGSLQMGEQPFAIVDLKGVPVHLPAGGPVAGFLGAPFMDDAVLCLDYRNRRMQRAIRFMFDRSGYTAMPMLQNHGLPTAVAIIDGELARLVVDSGNGGAIALFPSFVSRSHFKARYPDLDVEDSVGGSGRHFEVLKTIAEEVSFSQDTRLTGVQLQVIPQAFDPEWGIDGLIGYDVLSKLDPCLDRDGEKLMWKSSQVTSN